MGGFDGVIDFGIDPRGCRARPGILGLRDDFDRRIVDYLAHQVIEGRHVLVRQGANIHSGFRLGRNHIDLKTAADDVG